jgi:hypothetical protein
MSRPFFLFIFDREVIVNACLYDNFRRLPLEEAARQAQNLFNRSEHTAGLPIGALHLNPAEALDCEEVGGLPVKANEQVRPGFIRVVAAEDAGAELAADRGWFGERVSSFVKVQ